MKKKAAQVVAPVPAPAIQLPPAPIKTYEDGVKAGYEAAHLDCYLALEKIAREEASPVFFPKVINKYIVPLVTARRAQLPSVPGEKTSAWMQYLVKWTKDGMELPDV